MIDDTESNDALNDHLRRQEARKNAMVIAIEAASIVRYCHDMMAEGRGVPNHTDMRRFVEDSAALVQLWLQVTHD